MGKEPRSNKISVKHIKSVPGENKESNLKDKKEISATKPDTITKSNEKRGTDEILSKDCQVQSKPKEPDKTLWCKIEEMYSQKKLQIESLTTKSATIEDHKKVETILEDGWGRNHDQQSGDGEAAVGHDQQPGGGGVVQQGEQRQHPGQCGGGPRKQPLHHHQQQQYQHQQQRSYSQEDLKEKAKKNVLKESQNMQSYSWIDFGNLSTKDTKESRNLKTIKSTTEKEIFEVKKSVTNYNIQESKSSKENAVEVVNRDLKNRANNEGLIQKTNFHKSGSKNEILSCNHRRSFYHRNDMGPIRTGQGKIIKEIESEELEIEESGQNTKNRTRNTILQFENNLETQKRVISRLEGGKNWYINAAEGNEKRIEFDKGKTFGKQ